MSNFTLRNTVCSRVTENVKNFVSLTKMIQIRLRSLRASKLVYSEYGEPSKVINKLEETLDDVRPNEVLIKMLAAPVNPADINTIQGTYPSRPELPAVGGNEGVGEVIKLGSGITGFGIGDRVVPLTSGLGTWRTHAVLSQEKLYKILKDLGLVGASTLTVNPCTAYRMLKGFSSLKAGDVVVQNGANSACGQYIIQLCSAWGLRSVNVVRDRPNLEQLLSYLLQLGATLVITEEELRKTDLFKMKTLPKPKLALNCVGGRSALELMRHLETGSSIVTYGGMAREPVTVPVSALIFKDIHVRGFWMTRWVKENFFSPERFRMFDELIELMRNGKLRGPAHKMISFNDFKEALEKTLTVKGMVGKKYILNFSAL